jgi:hypothetical protein
MAYCWVRYRCEANGFHPMRQEEDAFPRGLDQPMMATMGRLVIEGLVKVRRRQAARAFFRGRLAGDALQLINQGRHHGERGGVMRRPQQPGQPPVTGQ